MLQILTVAIAALVAWTGILWLWLPIDIFKYSLFSIIAMHIAAPLCAVSAWFSICFWINKLQQAKLATAESAQQDIRSAEKTRLKNLFEDSIRIRRASIDCRWAAIADVVFLSGHSQLTEDTDQTHTCEYATPACTIQPWPHHTLIQLFQDLFAVMPGASTLPIAICASPSKNNDDVEKIVLQAHATAIDGQGGVVAPNLSPEIVFFVHDDRHPYTQLHTEFLKHREWPGLLVVAFDSLIEDKTEPNDWLDLPADNVQSDREKWHGKPSRSVCVLLMSQSELGSVLSKLADSDNETSLDNLTPHWERQQIPLGMASLLMKWPKMWRESFMAMPPIASLCRATAVTLGENTSTKYRTQSVRDAIGEAAIDASLIAPEFIFEGEVDASAKGESNSISTCGWLIHNAGDVAACGERVALLGTAMWNHDIEINPINQATNIVMVTGDSGVASRWLSLALAIQRVADNDKPALCAEFNPSDLLINFVVPQKGDGE